ncbi:MAG: hypothetical protein K0Q80_3104 [Microvirga sp.]|nr:hypothetical protein [Microvirga sp.]
MSRIAMNMPNTMQKNAKVRRPLTGAGFAAGMEPCGLLGMAADAAMVPYSLRLAVFSASAEVRVSTSTTTERPGRRIPCWTISGLTETRTGTR